MSVVVIYDISQTVPFHWYITCGLLIHYYHFRKVQFLSGAYSAATLTGVT